MTAQESKSEGALTHRTETLSRMIEHLEEQLDRMIAGSETLQRDLDEERKRRAELERVVDDLRDQLQRREALATTQEQLLAEVAQLKTERSRLDASVQDLERRLAAATEEAGRQQTHGDRLRAAHEDATEEVLAVEAQFERAMKMVAALKAQVTVLSEERDALTGRLKVADEELRQALRERDALAAEVEESRAALDEIHKSLVDACLAPPESGSAPR